MGKIQVQKNRLIRLWDPSEITYLISEYGSGVKLTKIARALGRSKASCHSKVCELKVEGTIPSGREREFHNDDPNKFTPAPERKFTDFIKVYGDVICISDVHIPFWHRKLFEYVLAIAVKFKIKTLIINGDFLNLDSFSRWVSGFKGKEDTMLELKTASFFLIKALKVFSKIYITQGNHEDRLLRQLEGQIPNSVWFRMLHEEVGKRIIVSDYPYIQVNDSWKIVHPKNYGGIGGKIPSEIADCEGMNIISGHNHQFGIAVSKNGKYVGIDHGCSCDPEQIEYYNYSVTTGRKWQPGFSMIRNNKGYAFSLNHTDWDFWLK